MWWAFERALLFIPFTRIPVCEASCKTLPSLLDFLLLAVTSLLNLGSTGLWPPGTAMISVS